MFGNDDKILLNISGHPLSDEAESQAKDHNFKVVSINVPNVDVTNPDSIIEYIHTIFETLSKNKNVITKIRKNDYAVIPAGLSILTASINAMLHGISGGFPLQLWLIRNEDGKFIFGEDLKTQIDLQTIRLKYRDFRHP